MVALSGAPQDYPPRPASPPWHKETPVLERDKTKQASLGTGLLCRQSPKRSQELVPEVV